MPQDFHNLQAPPPWRQSIQAVVELGLTPITLEWLVVLSSGLPSQLSRAKLLRALATVQTSNTACSCKCSQVVAHAGLPQARNTRCHLWATNQHLRDQVQPAAVIQPTWQGFTQMEQQALKQTRTHINHPPIKEELLHSKRARTDLETTRFTSVMLTCLVTV